MVTDGNQIYHGDHFVMYRNVKSLCRAPGINSVVGQLYLKNKQTHRKRDQICGYQRWDGKWLMVVKRYKLPVIRKISTRDVNYNMINIINTALCYM